MLVIGGLTMLKLEVMLVIGDDISPFFSVKVPQIVKVLRAGSADGLSYIAFILELLAATFTCTYNNAKGFRFRYCI